MLNCCTASTLEDKQCQSSTHTHTHVCVSRTVLSHARNKRAAMTEGSCFATSACACIHTSTAAKAIATRASDKASCHAQGSLVIAQLQATPQRVGSNWLCHSSSIKVCVKYPSGRRDGSLDCSCNPPRHMAMSRQPLSHTNTASHKPATPHCSTISLKSKTAAMLGM